MALPIQDPPGTQIRSTVNAAVSSLDVASRMRHDVDLSVHTLLERGRAAGANAGDNWEAFEALMKQAESDRSTFQAALEVRFRPRSMRCSELRSVQSRHSQGDTRGASVTERSALTTARTQREDKIIRTRDGKRGSWTRALLTIHSMHTSPTSQHPAASSLQPTAPEARRAIRA